MSETDRAAAPFSTRRRVAWLVALIALPLVGQTLWFLVWGGIVNLLPDRFFYASPAILDLVTGAIRVLLWIVVATLIGFALRLAANKWPAPPKVWVAAVLTSGVLAIAWLLTVAGVVGGVAHALVTLDFFLLALLPLASVSAAVRFGLGPSIRRRVLKET